MAYAQEDETDLPIEDEPAVEAPSPASKKPVADSGKPFDVKDLDVSKRSLIKHPLAEKGLTRITRERVYIYDVPEVPHKKGLNVRFGTWKPDHLSNEDGSVVYSDIYKDDAVMVIVDWEWVVFKSAGKLGIRAGTGIMSASGKGYLPNRGLPAREGFNFFMFPNSASAVYRLQVWDKQPLVPYGEAGLGYYTFAEVRDDNGRPKLGGSAITYFAGGGALNLSLLSRDVRLELEREYGIGNLWITTEYRSLVGLKPTFDLSANMVVAGLLVEY